MQVFPTLPEWESGGELKGQSSVSICGPRTRFQELSCSRVIFPHGKWAEVRTNEQASLEAKARSAAVGVRSLIEV